MAKKIQDYDKKNEKDLEKTLKEKEKQLVEEITSLTQRKIKDVHKPRKVRKEIARIKTKLSGNNLENKQPNVA